MLKLGFMVAVVAAICVSAATLASGQIGGAPDSLAGTVQRYVGIGLHSVLSIKGTFETVADDVKQATGLGDD